MVLGVSGFINLATKKALIRYVNPTYAEATGMSLERIDQANNDAGFIAGNVTSYFQELVGIVQTVKPDVRKSETHKYRSNVTENAMEDGSIVVQHIIQRPFEITLQFEETNAGKMISSMISGIAELGGGHIKTTFEKLTEIWEKKLPVQIVTEQRIYNNMVIQNMPIAQSQPYKGALKIMVDFIQLNTVSLSQNQYKGNSQAINKSASAKIDGGLQVAQTVAYKAGA